MTDKVTHVSKVPALADFKAPWETDAGEVEIVKPTLKKYIHGIVLDAAKRADRAEDAEAKIADAEKKASDAERELAAGDQTGKINELTTKLAEAESTGSKAALDLLRIKVGDEAGLTIKQSLRLQGTDEDSLKADADEILETFGVKKGTPDPDDDGDDDDGDDDGDDGQGLPGHVRRLNNPGDGRDRDSRSSEEIDIAKAVDGMTRFGSGRVL